MVKQELCVDARMATYTGIGTYIRHLLPRLASEYRIRILIDRASMDKCPELKSCDPIVTKTPIYSLQEQAVLPLKIPACDLFWSPHFNIPLGPICAKKRLTTIHDVFFLAYPQTLALHKRAYARLFFHQALHRSHHVITVSKFSKSEILKYVGGDESKITPILLGVDFQGSATQVATPPKYLLYVGNLSPNKNIVNLIRSLDFLPQEVHLLLVGKEFAWNAWKREVLLRKDRVHPLGKVDHSTLVFLYNHAEALLHPSLYEGFGLTPLEAMSVGCPCVVSKAASLPEVCGDAALYVDPLDPKDIARGVSELWNRPLRKEELRTKGFLRIRQFTWEKTVQQHHEVIQKVLKL